MPELWCKGGWENHEKSRHFQSCTKMATQMNLEVENSRMFERISGNNTAAWKKECSFENIWPHSTVDWLYKI